MPVIEVKLYDGRVNDESPFGGLRGSAWRPHEQGRAAIEFYTESVTIYQDAPLA